MLASPALFEAMASLEAEVAALRATVAGLAALIVGGGGGAVDNSQCR